MIILLGEEYLVKVQYSFYWEVLNRAEGYNEENTWIFISLINKYMYAFFYVII